MRSKIIASAIVCCGKLYVGECHAYIRRDQLNKIPDEERRKNNWDEDCGYMNETGGMVRDITREQRACFDYKNYIKPEYLDLEKAQKYADEANAQNITYPPPPKKSMMTQMRELLNGFDTRSTDEE